jgi:carbon storage regulator
MLILGRRIGESILIGDNVEVRVVDASSTRVKLGIVAPRDLQILRSEMRLAAEQNRASTVVAVEPATVARLVDHLRSTTYTTDGRR